MYVNRMNSLYLMFFINFGIDELLANFVVGFIGYLYLSSLILNKIGQLASVFDQFYWTEFSFYPRTFQILSFNKSTKMSGSQLHTSLNNQHSI